MVQFNRHLLHLKGRSVAIFITLSEVTMLAGIVLYLSVPSVIDEISQMSQLIRTYSAQHGSIPFIPDAVHCFV